MKHPVYENHILYKTYEFHMKYISRVGMEAHDHQNMQFFLTCIFRSLNVSRMSYILFSSKTWPIVVLMAAILNFAKKNVSSVSPACRKRRLIGAVCRNHRIKRLVPCRCLDGHVKEPYEMSMALGA